MTAFDIFKYMFEVTITENENEIDFKHSCEINHV